MFYALLAVFTLFCLVVGIHLATNHFTIWGVLIFLFVGITSVEVGYAAASFLMIWHR